MYSSPSVNLFTPDNHLDRIALKSEEKIQTHRRGFGLGLKAKENFCFLEDLDKFMQTSLFLTLNVICLRQENKVHLETTTFAGDCLILSQQNQN